MRWGVCWSHLLCILHCLHFEHCQQLRNILFRRAYSSDRFSDWLYVSSDRHVLSAVVGESQWDGCPFYISIEWDKIICKYRSFFNKIHLNTFITKWIFKYELIVFLSIVLPHERITVNSGGDYYTKHYAVTLVNIVWRWGENIKYWRLKFNICRKKMMGVWCNALLENNSLWVMSCVKLFS